MTDDARGRPAAIAVALRVVLRAAPDVQAALARRLGMGTTDIAALDHTIGSVGLGPVELARRLGIRSASASVLVDRLQARGHLQRTPHPGDRRRITLRPTDAARTQVRRALAPLLAEVDALAVRLSPHDADVVLRFLHEVAEVMRDFAADHQPEERET